MHSFVTSKNVKWCHLIWPTLYIVKKLQFITLLTAICIVSHIENSKNDKGQGHDPNMLRWWERRWWLWWGDMRTRWTRRVNRMRLTEWRRELIPQVRWCICERAVG